MTHQVLSIKDLQQLADNASHVILSAGNHILHSWHHIKSVTRKNGPDITTNVDREVELLIRNDLANLFPQAGFIVEEGITLKKAGYNWAIDPIDGTKNFAHMNPLFYTQIALLKDSEPVMSLVYQPTSNQLFRAIKGAGSYLNGRKLEPKKDTILPEAIIEIDSGPLNREVDTWKYTVIRTLSQKVYRTRMAGGFFSPYLATGAIDMYVNTSIHNPLTTKELVDVAPHKLIVQEAGYKTVLFNYSHHPFLVWAQERIIDKVRKVLISFKHPKEGIYAMGPTSV